MVLDFCCISRFLITVLLGLRKGNQYTLYELHRTLDIEHENVMLVLCGEGRGLFSMFLE